MKKYILPIIKKQKEEKKNKDNRLPLYRHIYNPEIIDKDKEHSDANTDTGYTEIDFNINDHIDINNNLIM
jgi:hypothetical protein|tara:strand:- start:249 stop:458 length:210 start_codon:yes stop_codon:yes gene_type:complete